MKFLPYARLMRLPNVFSAFADIAVGAAVASAYSRLLDDPYIVGGFLLLFASSGALYIGGMVWNDIFDIKVDRIERPFRPLPSGQIRILTAVRIGISFLFFGTFSMLALDNQLEICRRRTLWPDFEKFGPLTISILLAICILAYDGILKKFFIGPIAMAACRFLNMLLGMSIIPVVWFSWEGRLHIAATTALYILGVTWFAKQEATRSSRWVLILASFLIFTAVASTVTIPMHLFGSFESFEWFPLSVFLAAFLLAIGIPLVRAIREPIPKNVQAGVKRCILGLIVFDAILATIFVGWAGMAIALLLLPALILGKWVYST